MNLKALVIMIFACILIGACIHYFTGFYWVTATILVMVAILINGLIISNEDLDKGGFDYQAGITDTPDAKSEQRKANVIQLAVIFVLIILAVWSSI